MGIGEANNEHLHRFLPSLSYFLERMSRMKSEEKHIQVAKTARYFQSGQLSASTKRAWIVLHGYGQLASYFSKHFEDLVDSDTCVIAPEGLSRFYLDGKWDRVGATWMTKEDRLHEIEDYLAYLDALCDQLFGHLENQPEIVLLGFSQGTATAWRWLLKGKYTILIVAHRLSTIKKADRVVLMNNGSIECTGDFENLKSSSKLFEKMVELQEL